MWWVPIIASASGQTSKVGQTATETLLDQIRDARLDPEPLDAAGLRLNLGFAVLDLERGVLLPVRTIGGRMVEMVFVGEGQVRLEPPDEVEAGQLELFTGRRELAERFTEAVLVVANDPAAGALLQRPAATETLAETLRRASERHAAWKDSRERQTLGVETGILLDALGDPLYQDFFCGLVSRPLPLPGTRFAGERLASPISGA